MLCQGDGFLNDFFIVIGLGNPGKKYELTRHNTGYLVVDYLCKKHKIKLTKLKHKARIGEGSIEGKKVIFAKPQTFMNLSGESVRDIINWYRADGSNLVIIYDDIDLPLGNIRIREKGSAGTHKGMQSIIYHLYSDEFIRVRVGIGKPLEDFDLSNFVLSKFAKSELEIIRESIIKASEAVENIIKSGISNTMNNFN